MRDVVMPAGWNREPITAGDYLRLVRERGPIYRPAELTDLEELNAADRPPRDKWKGG